VDDTVKQINRFLNYDKIWHYDYHWVVAQISDEQFATEMDSRILLAKVTWIAALVFPVNTLPTLQSYQDGLERVTPVLLLISSIGVTFLSLITNTKGVFFTLTCTAVIIIVHRMDDSKKWYFNHFVTIPLYLIHIYHSDGKNRIFSIQSLSVNFFQYNPSISHYIYNKWVPANFYLRRFALVFGIYPVAPEKNDFVVN
jgi:hypothetical protein